VNRQITVTRRKLQRSGALVEPGVIAGAAATNWMTCVMDGREHAVTDAAFALGQQTQRGIYRARCGHDVAPRSLSTPPGPPCTECLAPTTDQIAGEASRPRPEWLRWLKSAARISGGKRASSQTRPPVASKGTSGNESLLVRTGSPPALATDPFAPVASRFALAGSSCVSSGLDEPSVVGVRPWGLRRARPAPAGRVVPRWSYCVERQLAVDSAGRPLIDMVCGDPSVETTSTTDGEDGPSSEAWNND
jgi:putative ATP-grasp target RiPP